jgi:hypothetical protein
LAQPPRVFTNRKSKIAYERALKDYALFENWYLKENAIDDLVIVGYALTRGLEPYFVVKKIWEYIHNE